MSKINYHFTNKRFYLMTKKAEIDVSEHVLPTDLQFNDTESNDADSKQSLSHIHMQIPSNDVQMYGTLIKSLASPSLNIQSFLSAICASLSFDAASVYSINHSLQKIACELSTLGHLNKNYSSSLNEGILSQIIEHQKKNNNQ
eukprot:30915_1